MIDRASFAMFQAANSQQELSYILKSKREFQNLQAPNNNHLQGKHIIEKIPNGCPEINSHETYQAFVLYPTCIGA